MIRHAAALLAAFTFAAAIARAAIAPPTPKAAASPAQLVPPISNPVDLPPPKPVPQPNAAPASFDLGVWTVHASSLDANFKTGDFNTPDKIVMTRTGGDVSADRANGNYKKKMLFLNGHVVMHDAQGGTGGLAGEPGGQRSGGPSTLTADRAQIDGDAKLYKAIGNVHYVQGETTVTADTGTLNDADHTLFLQGAVHIVSGTRNMTAQTVRYSTTTGDAHAQGNVTMQFPSEFHRHLATPKPLNLPKHGLLAPPSPSP